MADYGKLVEESRDAFNQRDPEAWVAAWNPDCEWHPFLTAREEGDPGYHGHNGIRAWFEDVDEMFSEIHVELEQIREVGDYLVVLGQMEAKSRGTGAEVNSEVAAGREAPARLGLHQPGGGGARGERLAGQPRDSPKPSAGGGTGDVGAAEPPRRIPGWRQGTLGSPSTHCASLNSISTPWPTRSRNRLTALMCVRLTVRCSSRAQHRG